MRMPSPKTTAAIGAVLSGATAVVTNLVTTRWNPALIAATAVLVAATAAVAVAAVAPGRPRNDAAGQLTTRRSGVIDRARMTLGRGAQARIKAAGTSQVMNLRISLDDGKAVAKATGHSQIKNSSITQQNP